MIQRIISVTYLLHFIAWKVSEFMCHSFRFPEECQIDLISVLYGPKRLALDENICRDSFYLKLEKLQWRVVITISSR